MTTQSALTHRTVRAFDVEPVMGRLRGAAEVLEDLIELTNPMVGYPNSLLSAIDTLMDRIVLAEVAVLGDEYVCERQQRTIQHNNRVFEAAVVSVRMGKW